MTTCPPALGSPAPASPGPAEPPWARCSLTDRPPARLQANSEVSALLGRIPSAVGYQPTLATDLGQLQERITSTKKGSITSVQVGGAGGGCGRGAGGGGSVSAGCPALGAARLPSHAYHTQLNVPPPHPPHPIPPLSLLAGHLRARRRSD